MSNKLYDVLKWVVSVFMPAAAVLLLSLGKQWGWDWTDNAIGTINAVTVFLGALLGISSVVYSKKNDD